MDKKAKYKIFNLVMSILLPLFIFVLVDLFYMKFCYNRFIIVADENTIIFSYFILYMVYFFLWGITKKSNRALIIMSVLLYVLSIANILKITYTDAPVVFSDILFLNNTGELTRLVKATIFLVMKFYLTDAIIYLCISIFICIIGIKCSVKIEKKKERIATIAISLIVLNVLLLPFKTTTNFLLNLFFNRNKIRENALISEKLENYGVFSAMYEDLLENRIFEPDNYNENTINEIVSNAENDSDNSFGQPNIIVLFAESFWDVDQLEEVEFNKEVTKNFNSLKDKGIFINMITPSYGGISSNIEFEFLTGANVMYFNKGYIPCMQLYKNNTYYDRPSIINELKNNGYKTKIVNYTSPTSFRIRKFYNYLKVDEAEFVLKLDEKNIKGNFVSDEYIVDTIIDEFNKKDKNEKLFYMTLTMQSHMPYLKEKYDNYDIKILKSDLSNDMNDVILSYSQGIYDTDKQLGRLYDYIQTLDEPTMIIFYGDHLPYLKTINNENFLESSKFFNTENEKLNIYRKYNTQSLILANFDIENDGTYYLSPDLLGCYVINRMDINISDYYKWLYNNKYLLSSANWYILMDADGNLYYTEELNERLKNAYDLRRNVQYSLFVK